LLWFSNLNAACMIQTEDQTPAVNDRACSSIWSF